MYASLQILFASLDSNILNFIVSGCSSTFKLMRGVADENRDWVNLGMMVQNGPDLDYAKLLGEMFIFMFGESGAHW